MLKRHLSLVILLLILSSAATAQTTARQFFDRGGIRLDKNDLDGAMQRPITPSL
jgi:hypothetical protein